MQENHVKELQKALNLVDQAVTIVKKVQVEIAREQTRAKLREKSGEA